MPNDAEKKFGDFAEVEGKLQAPTKKSVFERQKADAEAKRLREEAETKAVYEDFVKSFDDEDDNIGGGFGRQDGGGRLGGGGFGAVSGPPKRHYGQSGLGVGAPSGPPGRAFGSGGMGGRGVGSGPGSLGPSPSNLNKKTAYDGGFSQGSNRRDRDRDDRGVLAFDDYEPEKERGPAKAFQNSDDEDERTGSAAREEERAVPKPTLRLASLPPGT